MEYTRIIKEPVIGFIITQPIDGRLDFKTRAVIGDWEGNFEAHDLYDGGIEEKVIGVLPAPQNTFHVLGFGADNEGIPLGFEFAGAYYPDWGATHLEPNREEQEFDDLITAGTGVSKSQRTEFKKLREILRVTTDVYGEVLEETVLAAAETQGLGDAPRVLDMLKRLKEQGEIYALKEGVWVLS